MSCVEALEDHESQVAEESDDFIQFQVDSFFPPTEEEVIEEGNPPSSKGNPETNYTM